MTYKKIVAALRNCKNNTTCDKCPIQKPCFASGYVEDMAANVIEELSERLNVLSRREIDMAGKCGSCVHAQKYPPENMRAYIKCVNPNLQYKWQGTDSYKCIKQRCAKGCKEYEAVKNG